ncbi:PREDICTED: uncharacterized protein LOC104821934 [Tarenaya hassleriana]|uniref:uncharacterized protein LOC104821934 n=1 Tax=Tarenaya hassleriana TaxID=28532 RepID=UPI00053CA86C|nr:PREDICTED: uncharacterized protein LOC104821934 [Tarenaya hassleriana]
MSPRFTNPQTTTKSLNPYTMKRQRKKQGPTTSAASAAEKKIKTEAEAGMKTPENSSAAAVAAAAAAVAEEEEMGLLGLGLKGGDVDEQMSWGTVWMPFWDVEFVGRNYGVLFNDVLWDDDIWNLRTVTEIPQHVNK